MKDQERNSEWVLVPREPTEAMCGAIEYGSARHICETRIDDRMYFLRKAIAAAPTAPATAGDGELQKSLSNLRKIVERWDAEPFSAIGYDASQERRIIRECLSLAETLAASTAPPSAAARVDEWSDEQRLEFARLAFRQGWAPSAPH